MERDCEIIAASLRNIHFNSHAHVERDRRLHSHQGKLYHFNSHAHVERDDANTVYYVIDSISTHTLTWSVTLISQQEGSSLINFNSHAHVERDFTFTKFRYTHNNFNSHAHVERDIVVNGLCALYIIFQLTRSRGA